MRNAVLAVFLWSSAGEALAQADVPLEGIGVDDLAIAASSHDPVWLRVTLSWTAPTHDGGARDYEVRVLSGARINDQNWEEAGLVCQFTASEFGAETWIRKELPPIPVLGRDHFSLALRYTTWAEGNLSPVSNDDLVGWDATGPRRVDDLRVWAFTHQSLRIVWTTPEDRAGQGPSGTGRGFFRFSTHAPQGDGEEAWWNGPSTFRIDGADITAPGVGNFVDLEGLEASTDYYLGVRHEDRLGNLGPPSIVPATTDASGTTTRLEPVRQPGSKGTSCSGAGGRTGGAGWAALTAVAAALMFRRRAAAGALVLACLPSLAVAQSHPTPLPGPALQASPAQSGLGTVLSFTMPDLPAGLALHRVRLRVVAPDVEISGPINWEDPEIVAMGVFFDSLALGSSPGDLFTMDAYWPFRIQNRLHYAAVELRYKAAGDNSGDPEIVGVTGLSNQVTYRWDNIPPAPIGDLVLSRVSDDRLGLTWTAPGDDGREPGWAGRASKYLIRYSTARPVGFDAAAIEFWWNRAYDVADPPAPGPLGAAEEMEVALPPDGHLYFFMMKAGDEWTRWSDLSNLAKWGETAEIRYVETVTTESGCLSTGSGAGAGAGILPLIILGAMAASASQARVLSSRNR